MIRAALIALINDKTMNSYAESVSEGKVLTLTSTDVDNLDTIGEMFHETWGQVFEVAIGIAMLSWEVGWLAPVPLFIIFRKSESLHLSFLITERSLQYVLV